jgi:hypothetical protein
LMAQTAQPGVLSPQARWILQPNPAVFHTATSTPPTRRILPSAYPALLQPTPSGFRKLNV